MNTRATLMARSIISVTVEYDAPTGRRRKTFNGARSVGESRRFYAKKLKEGKHPRIVQAER